MYKMKFLKVYNEETCILFMFSLVIDFKYCNFEIVTPMLQIVVLQYE